MNTCLHNLDFSSSADWLNKTNREDCFDTAEFNILKLLSLLVGLSLTVLNLTSCSIVVPDWRHVDDSPFINIHEEDISNPVFTVEDVRGDIADADFVADPFLFHEDDTWYMFFELATTRRSLHYERPTGEKSGDTRNIRWGRIGLATSDDGLNWTYRRVVLDELYAVDDPRGSVHHSYPLVIKYDNRYFMITEAYMQNQIRFYEASSFPDDWERVYTITKCTGDDSTLVTPGQCITTANPAIGDIDPSLIRYQGKWWMFSNQGDDCYLYYSDHLLSGWIEHPLSPVVMNDSSKARPGGRAFVFDGDRIIRLAQKGDVRYGQRIRAFEVTTLTEDDYAEHEITDAAPFCTEGGVFCESGDISCNAASCEGVEDAWNLCGMHNLDPWWTGEHWLIITDGYGCNAGWSIGIYTTRFVPSSSGGKEPFKERDVEIREDVSDDVETRPDVQRDFEVR